MASARALNAIFRFKHQRPSEDQSPAFCEELRRLLEVTVQAILVKDDDGDAVMEDGTEMDDGSLESHAHLDPLLHDRDVPLDEFSSADRRALTRVWREVSPRVGESRPQRGEIWTERWFPEYASVLQLECVSVNKATMRLLGLDGWQRVIHSLPGDKSVHSAVPKTHEVFHCGHLTWTKYAAFCGELSAELAAAKKRTGEKRNAAHGEGPGHQKTPAFLCAAIRTAVEKTMGSTKRGIYMPAGGTTDVGLHTGGAPRDTCWALVRATLRQALPGSSALFEKVLLRFQSDLVRAELKRLRQISGDDDVKAFWEQVDTTFAMLQHVSVLMVEMIDRGYVSARLQRGIQQWRDDVDSVTKAWSEDAAREFALPGGSELTRLCHSAVPPILAAPSLQDLLQKAAPEDARAKALDANRGYEVIDGMTCPASALLQYLASVSTSKVDDHVSAARRTVEVFMYRAGSKLASRTVVVECSPLELLEIFNWYNARREAFSNEQNFDEMARVTTDSKVLLFAWIAFCLCHMDCCRKYPALVSRQVALDWARLSVAVLPEQTARETLREVARYVQKWNASATSKPVFDYSNHNGTIEFARAMGQTLAQVGAQYTKHLSAWDAHGKNAWRGIEQRKMRVVTLRANLEDQRRQLKKAKADLEEEWAKSCRIHGYRVRTWDVQVVEGTISRLTNSIRNDEAELDRLLQMKEFMVSPLPENSIQARAVLFLIFMPIELDILAKLSGQSQRELGPRDSTQFVVEAQCETGWIAHHSRHGVAPIDATATCYTSAFPLQLQEPTSFGPTCIDDVATRKEFVKKCTWFPRGDQHEVLWKESSGAFVNPSMIRDSDSKQHFIAEFVKSEHSRDELQWAVAFPGGDSRGNLSYAKSEAITLASDDFVAYTSLGTLRSYPVQQLRRVFEALQGDILDWQDVLVATVVKQTIYQVGDVTEAVIPSFVWHIDLESSQSVGEFSSIMQALAKKIDSSPSKWMSIPLLGEIADFLDQYASGIDGRQAIRSLSRTARRWAEEDRLKWRSGVSTAACRELRTRECLLYAFALMNYKCGPCSEEDLRNICELIVLFGNAVLFAVGDLRATVRQATSVVRQVMSSRIIAIMQFVAQSPDEILSHLCGLVNDRMPVNLRWTPVTFCDDRMSSCFESINSVDGTHYLVNLCTGSILTNGEPPGGLPVRIRQNEQFMALFGDQDFEVNRHEDVYSSAHSLGGCLYKFRVANDELIVEETSESAQAHLQLCSSSWLELLTAVFPRTLADNFAHWIYPDGNCVLLRQKQVSKRELYFVITFQGGQALCCEVPRADECDAYSDVALRSQSYNLFVAQDESLIRVFRKFEDPSFIHVMRSRADLFEICLPRFGLRFVQNGDGDLASVEFKGYVLATSQQLAGQMQRFRRYLVLVRATQECEKAERQLVIPCGEVLHLGSGLVDIGIPENANASIPAAIVEEHPRLMTLSTESLENRLLLAAIYAASDCLLPWSDLQMTGGEAANHLMRGCTSTRPLSDRALVALSSIRRFSYHTVASKVIAADLIERAQRLDFLFEDGTNVGDAIECIGDLDSYTANCKRATLQESFFRGGLRNMEELSSLGVSVLHVSKTSQRDSLLSFVKLLDAPVDGDFIRSQEMSLCRFVEDSKLIEVPVFPLAKTAMNTMGSHMIEEVEASWVAHHSVHQQRLIIGLIELATHCRVLLSDVTAKRDLMWRYLVEAVNCARSDPKDIVFLSAGFLPQLTKTDVLRSVLDEQVLLHFAPRLSQRSRRQFTQGALRFMELCVLEDKLERIISRAESASPPPVEYFGEELLCTRLWKSEEHPYWLVFEVEGRLQIRPEQYIIARHMIENPGSICQLNMGRGKTRVILPMLFLYYRHTATDRVVRSHFLAPLLSETRQFMHRVLSAGSLRLPFTELPFNRTIELDLDAVLLMQEAVDEVKRSGGFLMIAPEHRLSLELKRVEVVYAKSKSEDNDDLCQALDTLLDSNQYVDVFDESDALLHHKYHLVYAIGVPAVLDGGSCRWLAAEALLRVLTSTTSRRVMHMLNVSPGMFNVQTEYRPRRGAFNGFRLNIVSEDEVNRRVDFKRALVEDLMEHAPYELSWLNVFSQRDQVVRKELISALTDCGVSCDAILERMPDGIENVKEQILALRGLLAYGVLENCLEKRNRVNYGLPEPGSRPKLLAIPFTAADLPADRSEFSHPDVSITLTLLAFYHAGLGNDDIRKTFVALFRLDYSERICYYDNWFKSIESTLDLASRELLCSLDHISLDNMHQFAVVCDAYQFSMEVINFFLNRHVFPRDTKQYPKRLSRSAWDLVRGTSKVGFSGTNDTHRLLPVGVTQSEPNEAALRGTNGKMIDLLLTSTIGYEAIAHESSSDSNSSVATWKKLLLQALAKNCRALIDTGALLAGVGLDGAARFLLAQEGFVAAGVTYYDTRKQHNCWMVLERERQMLSPLKASSIHERDTFVIFDEARSRGSDMKLVPDAVALLTLGPAITKDKLMQGAGRLRQLGRNQKLWLSSTSEVYDIVSHKQTPRMDAVSTGDATTLDVLNWVMQNTEAQSTIGVLEWADNGIRFCENRASSENELQDEEWGLQRMYGDAVESRLVFDVVAKRLHVTSTSLGSDTVVASTTKRIESHARTYGLEDSVRVTGFAEECERELQVEEEEEVEDETPCLVLEPCEDKRWNYRELLKASSVNDLSSAVSVMPAFSAVREFFFPPGVRDLAWTNLNLYGTTNFWSTVHRPSSKSDFVWNGFMRTAGVVLVFPDNSVLMLSEREADEVLKMLLVDRGHKFGQAGPECGCFGLVHVNFALHTVSSTSKTHAMPSLHIDGQDMSSMQFLSVAGDLNELIPLASIPLSSGFSAGNAGVPSNVSISLAVITACRFLNGDTHFASHTHPVLMERVLRPLIKPIHSREQTLRSFVEARRMTQRWSMSFLQDLAKRMDLEDCEINVVQQSVLEKTAVGA